MDCADTDLLRADFSQLLEKIMIRVDAKLEKIKGNFRFAQLAELLGKRDICF